MMDTIQNIYIVAKQLHRLQGVSKIQVFRLPAEAGYLQARGLRLLLRQHERVPFEKDKCAADLRFHWADRTLFCEIVADPNRLQPFWYTP